MKIKNNTQYILPTKEKKEKEKEEKHHGFSIIHQISNSVSSLAIFCFPFFVCRTHRIYIYKMLIKKYFLHNISFL